MRLSLLWAFLTVLVCGCGGSTKGDDASGPGPVPGPSGGLSSGGSALHAGSSPSGADAVQTGGAPNRGGNGGLGGSTGTGAGAASRDGGFGAEGDRAGKVADGSAGQSASTKDRGPTDDSLGRNPFDRSAEAGILITSSDGLNSTHLLLAADAEGGMFLAGATRNPRAMGLFSFDTGIDSEAFAARLDAGGNLVWTVPLKACGVPADIATGPDNSVYVLCPYEPDTTDLMPFSCTQAALVERLDGEHGDKVFEARVEPPIDPVADGFLCPYGLGVDRAGVSYIGGAYSAVFPIERAFFSAVDGSGHQSWTVISEGASDTAATSPAAYATDVDVNSQGDLIFTGSFNKRMRIGSVELTSQAVIQGTTTSSYNGFVGRMTSAGTDVALFRFGGAVYDLAAPIRPTSDGDWIVGGLASAVSSIGGKSLNGTQNGAAFLARMHPDGQAVWATTLPSDSMTRDLALDSGGKVHFVGQFANDELFYTYDPSNNQMSVHSAVSGTASANKLQTAHIAVSTTGGVWITGTFTGTIDLGTGPLSTSTVSAFVWHTR